MNDEDAPEKDPRLAEKPPKLNPKEWVDKRLADERKTVNPQSPEVIAKFLATQAGATDNLIELLNRVNFSLEEKKELVNESCESTNRWAGYTHGRWPGDKGEQINPGEYYKLLSNKKVASFKTNAIPTHPQLSPLKKTA